MEGGGGERERGMNTQEMKASIFKPMQLVLKMEILRF